MMETSGRKEVAEQVIQGVLIAAFSAVATGLINWQIERMKKDDNKDRDGNS